MLVVMKFGGTSLGDISLLRDAAAKAKAEWDSGNQVVMVVSAMGKTTNGLLQKVNETSSIHDLREYDTVLSAGEQISSGLMAVALQEIGISARSFQGWQIPITTDQFHGKAHIRSIDTVLLKQKLSESIIPVCAGFQGICEETKRITTLGRGGTDTSAVLIAAALGADRCDIYTDVKGVYTTDPNIVQNAKLLHYVNYNEMLEMASLGAKILHVRSVEAAKKYKVPLRVLSSFDEGKGTEIDGEEKIMENVSVTAITHHQDVSRFTLTGLPDKPMIAAKIFQLMAEGAVNIDMIIQSSSVSDARTDMTFTLPLGDSDYTKSLLEKHQGEIGFNDLLIDNNVVKLSVIGSGMSHHPGVASKMFSALGKKGINIQAISTSEIKISVIIDADTYELALRTLHQAYELDKE